MNAATENSPLAELHADLLVRLSNGGDPQRRMYMITPTLHRSHAES